MCSRYILINSFEQIRKRFELPLEAINITPNYNISAGQYAYVITDEKSNEIQLFKFGLTPFWAKREMLIITARSEGDYNKEDYPDFKGAKGIILKPAFRKPIRSQRCLVLASAFIEGTKESRLSIPYLVYLRNHKNPFAFAGIWDTWLNPRTGFPENSFCIITTTANSLMQKLGHLRMPVILSDNEEKRWIKPTAELTNITSLLNRYDSKLMNAYHIDPKIKNPLNNDKQLIQPIGERILIEEKPFIHLPYASGYYHSRKTLHDHNPFIPYTEKASTNKSKENPGIANK
jgi:putative SOS response-associated peptidase YedK